MESVRMIGLHFSNSTAQGNSYLNLATQVSMPCSSPVEQEGLDVVRKRLSLGIDVVGCCGGCCILNGLILRL